MPYSTIIDFGVIVDGLRGITLSSIGYALNALPALAGIPLFLLSLIGLWLSYENRIGFAGILFLLQGILLLGALGWMGLPIQLSDFLINL